MPAVSVAIATLKSGAPLAACLSALRLQTFRDFDVVVVDNGGCEDLESFLKILEFRILRPGHNVGFAAAVNLVLRNTDSAWLATLNDDAAPEPEWLEEMLSAADNHDRTGHGRTGHGRIGMCASLIKLAHAGHVDSAGMLICRDGNSRQRGHLRPAASFAQSEEVLCPSACAALYRRGMLEDIGGFDEDFFMYCEDTDLGLRAQWAGWRCVYAPRAVVHHLYSATAGAFSPLKARLVERNRLWVAIKNFPLGLILLVPAASLTRYLFQLLAIWAHRGAASAFVRSKENRGATVFAIVAGAWWETFRMLPALMRKRVECARRRRMTSIGFFRLVRRHSISLWELSFSG
jgi:GT2 family glycosyltransferase